MIYPPLNKTIRFSGLRIEHMFYSKQFQLFNDILTVTLICHLGYSIKEEIILPLNSFVLLFATILSGLSLIFKPSKMCRTYPHQFGIEKE